MSTSNYLNSTKNIPLYNSNINELLTELSKKYY